MIVPAVMPDALRKTVSAAIAAIRSKKPLDIVIAEDACLWEAWRVLGMNFPNTRATLSHDYYCRYIEQQGMIAAAGISETINRYRA